MRFAYPWALALILVVPVLIALSARRGALGHDRSRRTVIAVLLRIATIVILVVAAAGPQRREESVGVDVVFVVDVSDSVAAIGRRQAEDFVERALAADRDVDRAAIVLVARGATVERSLQSGLSGLTTNARVDGGASTLADGVVRALSLLDAGRDRSIVVLSDGLENRGDLERAARIAARAGVRLDTVPLRAFASDGEVFVRRVDAPAAVRVGETHEFAAVIFATDPTPADIVVLRDGQYFGEERVTLGSGDNVIAFDGRFDEPGVRRYTVRVDAPRDTIMENNEAGAVLSVIDESRVLYVAGNPSRPYLAALRAQGLRVTVVAADELPGDVPSLSAYDLVILDNIPAYDLSIARMQSLERYVRDTGGGLIAVGGDRSFGAGGWFGTPLERLLPVDMDATSTMKIPSVSMLFLIDKSGSMGAIEVSGVTRLDLVKEAVVSALEIMNPFHRVGVIAFDADAEWSVAMTQAGERDAIMGNLVGLEPGGGTVLGPALRDAIDALALEEAVTRHVIVLSDGLTSDGDLTPLVRELADRSITVSTVSVGASADRQLMRAIAETGGGRSYHAGSAADVPRIFADETSIVSRNMVVEEVFVPSIASRGSILAGFVEADIPPLRGFVLTYPKPAADVLLIGPGDNPILAAWRYGLGRSVAFTSDFRGRWASEWLDWAGFARFAGQVARWAQRQPARDGLRVAVELDTGTLAASQASIAVDARTPSGAFRNNLDLAAIVQPPAGDSFAVAVDQVGPGAYQARFDVSDDGLYLVSVVDHADGSVRTSGVEVSYNQEYTRFDTDYALLERAAQIGGGRMLTNDEAPAVFASSAGSLSYSDRAWRILLALALALLVTEIVVRKLT